MIFFRRIFEKDPNFKFYGNPSSGSQVVSCGQTGGYIRDNRRQSDRHYEANSLFSEFCERA
jgi:hypothetical protein